jgi:hypothetical protein
MATCNVSVAAMTVAKFSTVDRTPGLAFASPVRVHSGPTFAPELPPPRA